MEQTKEIPKEELKEMLIASYAYQQALIKSIEYMESMLDLNEMDKAKLKHDAIKI